MRRSRKGRFDRWAQGLGLVALVAVACAPAHASDRNTPREARASTLEAALAAAYRNNPEANAQRAALRAVDENVALALSGYRPRINLGAEAGIERTATTTRVSTPAGRTAVTREGTLYPVAVNLTIDYTLFDGFQTGNRVRNAESQIRAAREQLRLVEQDILLDAATAYMNVLRDQAILDLNKRNLDLIEEQLRASRDRFNVGEVTRTDVAQAEARLAGARSEVLRAEAQLKVSRAIFRQVVGVDFARFSPGRPVERFLPTTTEAAVSLALTSHPRVVAAQFLVDAANFNVKIEEGALLPRMALQGSASQALNPQLGVSGSSNLAITGRVSVPIYQGGAEYASIRQAKETLGQRRIEVELQRDAVRALVVQAFGQLEAARAQIKAAEAQIEAAEIALNGVREEARVGQRTTLDVLNAQQELLQARVGLVTAQRDRVVQSYAALAALGRLTPQTLGLGVEIYEPRRHYNQVRDAWIGVRLPDGR